MHASIILSVCALFVAGTSGSAIPMWEFLSKDEKMSFLYNMFENQVHDYCETSACKWELLKYGLKRLKAMPEADLDKMDPYQRGSSDIIWASMMEGHAMSSTTKNPKPTTTGKPNSYDDQSFSDDFGSQTAGSAKIETVYKIQPPKNYAPVQYTISSGPQQFVRPNDQKTHKYVINQESYPSSNGIQSTDKIDTYGEYIDSPLSGPSVVRVYPDGTPVEEEDKTDLQDEDLRQYQLSQMQLPNL